MRPLVFAALVLSIPACDLVADAPCPTAPTVTADYFPLAPGDVWAFDIHVTRSASTPTSGQRYRGTQTWTAQSEACASGARTIRVEARFDGTLEDRRDGASGPEWVERGPRQLTYTFEVSESADGAVALAPISAEVFALPAPTDWLTVAFERYRPASAPDSVVTPDGTLVRDVGPLRVEGRRQLPFRQNVVYALERR
ncbi:hypothetical protein [Rubrivirga sp. IMCC45206]|uniref:hypothetical protein n=1 Tax=Rubrivirga sp. IMCC45206 TaxID=3391614 RepID=UPI0039902BB5